MHAAAEPAVPERARRGAIGAAIGAVARHLQDKRAARRSVEDTQHKVEPSRALRLGAGTDAVQRQVLLKLNLGTEEHHVEGAAVAAARRAAAGAAVRRLRRAPQRAVRLEQREDCTHDVDERGAEGRDALVDAHLVLLLLARVGGESSE